MIWNFGFSLNVWLAKFQNIGTLECLSLRAKLKNCVGLACVWCRSTKQKMIAILWFFRRWIACKSHSSNENRSGAFLSQSGKAFTISGFLKWKSFIVHLLVLLVKCCKFSRAKSKIKWILYICVCVNCKC